MYDPTVEGQEFAVKINSEDTDKIVDAINMVADNNKKEANEDKTYNNATMAKTENQMVNDDAKYKGTFTIQSSKNTGYVLDITAGSTKSGANTQLYKSNGTAAQQFEFVKNSDGTYSIKNTKSGLMLDVAKNGNVQQYKSNGTVAQKWKIIENNDGSVSFKSLRNGLMLDVQGGKTANKTNIHTYKANGSGAQKFYLKRLAQGSKYIGKDGMYLTQEEGLEILSTKYGLLTPLSKGDGVIPADMTAKLYDIATNYDKFDASGFKLPPVFEGTTNNNNNISYTVGDINIAGNTNLTKKDLDAFRKQIVEDVKNAITSDMRKYGYKPALA